MTVAVVRSIAGLENVIERIARARDVRAEICDSLRAAAAVPDLVGIFVEWPLAETTAPILELLSAAQTGALTVPVIVILQRGLPHLMQRALAAGATDVLLLPLDVGEVSAEIEQMLTGNRAVDGEMRVKLERLRSTTLIGNSAVFRRCIADLQQAASSDANVLLLGETGTGKEMIAQAIHELSSRASEPYVAVNCAAFPAHLIESEFFGHVKGAFTGADRDRDGRFAAVRAGTLLLDEVGEMEPTLQVKLLRVVEVRTFERLGQNASSRFHGRVIAATSINVDAAIAAGRFRADLMGRLDQFRIAVPPLRARREDVPLLARHFLAKHSQGRPIDIGSSALDMLCELDYPMNIRQLENDIRGAITRCYPSALIMPQHLRWKESAGPSTPPEAIEGMHVIRIPRATSYADARRVAIEAVDGCYLQDEVQRLGSQAAAAKSIGIDRKTLAGRLRKRPAGDANEPGV